MSEYKYTTVEAIEGSSFNAMATIKGDILVTEGMMDLLPYRQYEAILMHEETHLDRKSSLRFFIMNVCLAVFAIVMGVRTRSFKKFLFWNTMSMFPSMLIHWQEEFAADRGSVRKGADPEDLIEALGLLHIANCYPNEWIGLQTHPTLKMRAWMLGVRNSNKLHWHIRMDMWMGNRLSVLTRGRFDSQIKSWFDNKYPRI